MNLRGLSGPLCLLLTAAFACSTASASGTYTIYSTNVTISPTNSADTHYTVGKIPDTGTLWVTCSLLTKVPSSTRAPFCYPGIPHATAVTAGQTVTGTLTIQPYGSPIAGIAPAVAFAFAGPLLIFFRPLRRFRWATGAILLACLSATIALAGCGGNANGLTKGTYQFSISATNTPDNAGSTSVATSTFNVIVE
jgi:hypothetical protein